MAIKETVQIDVQTNADKTADDLTSAIKDLNAAIEKMTSSVSEGFNESAKKIDEVNEGIKRVTKTSKDSSKGVNKLSKAFGSIGKASGILFLVEKGLEILKDLFSENQIVVDAFNTAFEFLSIAFNDFVNFIVSNTGNVTNFFKGIFQDPKQALLDFADAFKRNIQERFESYLDTLGYLASAVKKVFSGDFAGALKDVKSAGKESLDVLTGVNNTFDKGKEAIGNVVTATKDYVTATAKAAAETVKLNKEAELSDAIRQGLIEKYDLEAEKLRQVRDDERNTIADRIKANEELGAVLDKQEAEMMAAAQTRLNAAQREADKKKGNLEAEKALIEAQNELAGVQAQVAGFRSEQLSNEEALQRELLELNRGKIEAENEAAEMEKQAAIDAELDVIKRIELEKELAKAKKDARIKLIEDELALTQQGTLRYQELLNERLLAEAEYNSESNRLDQESEQEKINRRMETQQAITQMAVQGLDAISALSEAFAGESEAQQRKAFQVQKALSAANTVVSTIEAAQNAYSTAQKSPITAAFPAYPAIQAGLATAFGVAKLRQIQNSKFESPEAPTETSAPTGAAFTPSFNVVGASGTNQIAQSLRQQGPVRAYVVGSDVSSQQEMDRKRVKNATL
jgi:hypothetical protein